MQLKKKAKLLTVIGLNTKHTLKGVNNFGLKWYKQSSYVYIKIANTREQVYFFTFNPGLSYIDIFNNSFSKAKEFQIDPPEVQGMETCSKRPCHITNMT